MTEPTDRSKKISPPIHQGPIEGIQIVNGRPQVERADMPTISFEWIEMMLKEQSEEQRRQWLASQEQDPE